MTNLNDFISKVKCEYIRASELYPKFHSYHEGYAVILEELDELWDLIKSVKFTSGHIPQMETELVQVAAMCLKFSELFNEKDDTPDIFKNV